MDRVSMVGAACLTACASAAPPPAQTAEPAEASAPSEPRVDAAVPSTDVAERAAKPAAEPPLAGDPVDLGVWCADHGLVASLEVERCYPARLEPHPDEALWCLRREELDDRRVLYFEALYRVAGKRLAKVLELAYAVGPRPMDGQEPGYYVKLSTSVAADGRSFELSDSPGPSCREGKERVREEFAYDPSLEKPIEALVARVCGVRGKYAATGQRR